MSEANTINQAMSTQFKGYSGLSFVDDSNIITDEDEIDIVKDGKLPFINSMIIGLRVVEIPNMRLQDYERRIYTAELTFAVRSKKKKEVMSGSATFKGIWDLYDEIKNALKSDLSIGGTVTSSPFIPEVEVAAVRDDNLKFWIGMGAIAFKVYKDVYVKSENILGGN